MNVLVVSYSLTGNNEALAASIAAEFAAEHYKIIESKRRTMVTIILDILFNRTPLVNPISDKIVRSDLVLFVGPVWMGKIASPFRAWFKQLTSTIGNYAFISISGGVDGPNPNITDDLKNRLAREPLSLIDLHIADLLPQDPKPTRKVTMAYHLNDQEIKKLTDTIVKTLRETKVI